MKGLNKILIIILGLFGIISGVQYYEVHQFDDILNFSEQVNISFENEINIEKGVEQLFKNAKDYDVGVFRVEYKKNADNQSYYNVYVNDINKAKEFSQKIYTKNNIYEIKSDKELINNEEATGQYYIYGKSSKARKKYQEVLNKQKDLKVSKIDSGVTETTTIFQMYKGVILFLVIILLILNMLIITTNQKEYAIYKMNGYSPSKIIIKNMQSKIKEIFLVILILLLITLLWITYNEYPQVIMEDVFKFEVAVIIILILIVGITQLYIFKLNNNLLALKNKTKDGLIEVIYFILKCILQLSIVVILIGFIMNTQNLTKYLSDYKLWKDTSNIAYTRLYDTVEANEDTEAFKKSLLDLYLDMEKNLQAELIDASSYQTLKNDPFCKDNYYSTECAGITVNQNYIKNNKQFANYINGNSKLNNTIFVPEKYRDDEKKIIKEYQEYFYLSNNDIIDEFAKNYSKDKISEEKVNIIWTKDVSVFTQNPDISSNGIITNPIVVVKNKLNGNDLINSFSQGEVYFNVKDANNPYNTLKEYTEKYGLENEIKTTPTVFSRYAQNIQKYKKQVVEALMKIILLLFTYAILIMNNIVIFYEKNKKLYSIKKMFGYRSLKIYTKYFTEIGYSWIGSLIIYILGTKMQLIPKENVKILLMLIGVSFVIEIFVSVIYFRILENKNIIKVLKEG